MSDVYLVFATYLGMKVTAGELEGKPLPAIKNFLLCSVIWDQSEAGRF